MSNYEIRLNEKEERLSEASLKLKMHQQEIIKLKSEKDKLFKKIGQLKRKSEEVTIHAYSHNAS